MGMYTIPRVLTLCPICGGLIEYEPEAICRNCGEIFKYDSQYKVFRNPNIVDISYRDPESSVLSNLFPHSFYDEERGIMFASMEAYLRSLTWNVDNNIICDEIAPLFGINAVNIKYALPDWKKKQILFWNGTSFLRKSDFYMFLLTEAYDRLYDDSITFRMALKKTKGKILIHSVGKKDPGDTLLTSYEFVNFLTMMRE